MPWTWSGSIRVSNYRIYRYFWNLRINRDELYDLHGNILTEFYSRDEIYIDEAGMMDTVFTWGTAESQNPFVIQLEWFENSWIFLLKNRLSMVPVGLLTPLNGEVTWKLNKRPPTEKIHLNQTLNFGVPSPLVLDPGIQVTCLAPENSNTLSRCSQLPPCYEFRGKVKFFPEVWNDFPDLRTLSAAFRWWGLGDLLLGGVVLGGSSQDL